MLEELRVPVHVDDVEELAHGVVVDPEDAVVEVLGVFGVVLEGSLHLGGPVASVKLRVVPLPQGNNDSQLAW